MRGEILNGVQASVSHSSRLIAATSKIVRLSRRGQISAARKLFDEMPERDTVAWNAMLTAYSHSGRPPETLSLFSRMRLHAAEPDPFSFTAVVAAASDLRDLWCGRKYHALLLRLGLHGSLPVSNSLIDMYGKCSRPADAARVFGGMEERNDVTWCSLLHGYVTAGQFEDAHELFGRMPNRSTVAWNTLIAGYAQLGEFDLCLRHFREMQLCGLVGDAMTFASLINACSEMADPCLGCTVHAISIRRGWSDATEVSNSMLSFYANFAFRDDALKVFDAMASRTVISWNAMIDASVKFGDVEEALSLFRRAPETNAVSWTAMIAGFARSGRGEEALAFLVGMTMKSFKPDDFTYGAALHACATMALLDNGRMVHGCSIRSGFDSYLYVANGLVNMYARCGDICCSSQVFDRMRNKDLVSWNAMLFGFALHGWPQRAFQVLYEMMACGVLPDKFTFMGLLMACNHTGLIEQGKTIFRMMRSVDGLPPDAEHEACVIDMLGRAGQLNEAIELLDSCSTKVTRQATNAASEALLSACATVGDVGIGKDVGIELVGLEPYREVGYVLLSNLYCAKGLWREAERVRSAMVEQGVKKAPGCSWIETRDSVDVFVSGRHYLDGMADVSDVLDLLGYEMRNPSCFLGWAVIYDVNYAPYH